MKKINLLFALLLLCGSLSARTWHVSPNGSDTNDGTAENPVRTISKAAYHALACDTVLIYEGVYRERVSPENRGFNNRQRITYMAVPGQKVELKGSEIVKEWTKESKKSNIWVAVVPNTLFGDFNPFEIKLAGDWLHKGNDLHLGEVYLDGQAIFETANRDELADSKEMLWSASVDDENTTISVNFGDADPNKSLVEINVRPTCFFPKSTGISYITVKGLTISQAATQWAPPTGDQIGIIGPNWSKGWIIEDCEVFQSKCVGISIGKEKASGHNSWSLYDKKIPFTKHGFTREIEAIFSAYNLGWSKENVGSHIIRNNKIHDCYQAGIVGHLGCIFSVISGNEIYDIAINRKIGGFETAGIKLHAAIDVIIENNCVVNTGRGFWLDWQAQGTHVVGNLMDKNSKQDIVIEVSHGPTLVYNNILLSNQSLQLRSQGVAFFNNIFDGMIDGAGSSIRYTPYHVEHSTMIKGLFNFPGGDMRFYNNIFLGNGNPKTKGSRGLETYKNYPISADSLYNGKGVKGNEGYLYVKLPVVMGNNAYFGEDTKPHPQESGFYRFKDKKVEANLEKKDGKYYLDLSIDNDALKDLATTKVTTELLG